ncbi:hypothetical protein RB195_003599 [Necator americanus]|uniref:Uncharacterized protein n=1 Tax=Necator americanus TaxID=51031 RepID=A0ABR1DPJ9_NECAM
MNRSVVLMHHNDEVKELERSTRGVFGAIVRLRIDITLHCFTLKGEEIVVSLNDELNSNVLVNPEEWIKYLGSKVTSTGDIDQEGRASVNAAWMEWQMKTGDGCASCCPLRIGVTLKGVKPAADQGFAGWTV